MGPDEFHEKYPGAAESGLRNNAYTNVMVAWICEQAQVVLGLLTQRRRDTLRAKLGLGDEEIARWQEMSHKMYVPFHGDGIISQFEGYEELRRLFARLGYDWAPIDDVRELGAGERCTFTLATASPPGELAGQTSDSQGSD